MQGYDSVALDIDVEIGGNDQTFNMLAGRMMLKRLKNKEKIVIATTLLTNPTTGEKLMSKSLGTGIGLNENPREMFIKIMKLPDEGIIQCFIDCTRNSMEDIEAIKRRLKNGESMENIKIELAESIVAMYHSKKDTQGAYDYWKSISQQTHQKDEHR